MKKRVSTKKETANSVSKKNYSCERRKISKKETEDFTEACIGLLFGNSDGLQDYADKYL